MLVTEKITQLDWQFHEIIKSEEFMSQFIYAEGGKEILTPHFL